jgi:glycosyltransferase involved in cell wall biosynthesis
MESLSCQKIKSLELVIVDDYSADNSLEIIKKWLITNRRRFKKVSLLVMTSNAGPAIARNVGIQHCSGKYCFMLDADNILFPGCLNKLAEALDNSSAAFSYSIISKFDMVEECLGFLPWDTERLQRGNYIDTMALVRKSWFEQIGYYSDNPCTKLGWEDYDLWIKTALSGGRGILVPQILAKYRVHSNSRSFTTQNPNTEFLLKILKEQYPAFWE